MYDRAMPGGERVQPKAETEVENDQLVTTNTSLGINFSAHEFEI
jgi:hypothetical protein